MHCIYKTGLPHTTTGLVEEETDYEVDPQREGKFFKRRLQRLNRISKKAQRKAGGGGRTRGRVERDSHEDSGGARE